MGLYGVAVQQDLAAAAQRQAGGCADHGERRELEPPVRLLAHGDQGFDQEPGMQEGGD